MRLVEILANLNISIHVPSWGTTVPTRVSTRGPSLFQSTFPRGERLYLTTRNMRAAIFQSTFPRGERLRAYEYLYPPINFNPRSLVGNDEVSLSRTRSKPIFQSTFPRGERPTSDPFLYTSSLFQSTFPRGERQIRAFVLSTPTGISIHVPSWGTTANFHKYSLFFYAINIIFLLFIIPSLFSLVLFMLLF